MDHPSDDLPAGAEACSISSRTGQPRDLEDEPIQMSQKQIAAGIQFLINKHKRKSVFTNDEEFFVNEFKAVEPVIVDSVNEMEDILGQIRNTFTFSRTVGQEVVAAFKTLRVWEIDQDEYQTFPDLRYSS